MCASSVYLYVSNTCEFSGEGESGEQQFGLYTNPTSLSEERLRQVPYCS